MPTCRHENPHRLAPAAPLPDLAGPDDLKAMKIQPNTGNFPYLVISADRLHENVHPSHVRLFQEKQGTHLYAVPINGGVRLRKGLGKGDAAVGDQVIVKALTSAIAGHCNPVTTTVFPLLEAGAPTGGNYAGPIPVGILVQNANDRTRIEDQVVFAGDRTFGFIIVSPEQLAVPWTFTIVTASIGGGTPGAELALRAAISLWIWYNAAFGLLLDQLTYATAGQLSLDERRYRLSQTIDCRYNEESGDYTVYVKPSTTDAVRQRELTALIQTVTLQHEHYIFMSKINPSAERPGPRCVSCKNDDHYEAGCPLTKRPGFWGPTTQLKDATEGLLAQPNNGGGRGRGQMRGQTRGNGRSRSRGRGGRGG
ncbi:hypothetical protein C8R45DRAFT_992306, partial [Mycena sanguinolenta]